MFDVIQMPYSQKIRETTSIETFFRFHFKIDNKATKFSIKLFNGLEENPYIGTTVYSFEVSDNLTNVAIKTGDLDGDIQLLYHVYYYGKQQKVPVLLYRRETNELKINGTIVCFEASVSAGSEMEYNPSSFTVRLIHDPQLVNNLG
uniref:Galectin n=1 Tax=Meloidogyne javanica TaxID=6303 RepID=A0A915MCX4_MELJA